MRIHGSEFSRKALTRFALPLLAAFAVVFALGLSALGLSACGSDQADAASTDAGNTGTASTEATTTDTSATDANSTGAAHTAAFQSFLKIMSQREHISHKETGSGGYIYSLDDGSLSVSDAGGVEIWRSSADWWVDDFRLGDVDGDGNQDFVFSLWKSFRFGNAHPARMENDDETVRNHLFVYTVLGGNVKAIWGSSDLPYPIYSFDLDPSGAVTPVSSGMLLKTREGEYRDDFVQTASVERTYAWQGWGFVPLN